MKQGSTLKLLMCALLLFGGSFGTVMAQQEAESPVNIDVTIQNQDNVTRQSETRPAEDAEDLQGILKEYGIEDELRSLEPGEEVEIIVRRKKQEEVTQDIVVELERPRAEAPKPPLLGVYYMVDPATNGSRITDIIPNTAAAKAGLQEDDVILEFEGKPVQGMDMLRNYVSGKSAGEFVTIEVLRDDETFDVRLQLGVNNMPVMQPQIQEFRWNNMGRRPNGNFNQDLFKETEEVVIDNRRPMLGVHTSPFHGEEQNGVEITKIVSGTLAEKIGLQSGDRVVMIDGEYVHDTGDIGKELKDNAVGDQVVVKWEREGREMEASGKLTGWTERKIKRTIDFEGLENGEYVVNGKQVQYEVGIEVDDSRPMLGVRLNSQQEGNGILINGVIEGSLAEQVGLQKGDRVKRVNGKTTSQPGDISAALEGAEIGSQVYVLYRRGQNEMGQEGTLTGWISHTKKVVIVDDEEITGEMFVEEVGPEAKQIVTGGIPDSFSEWRILIRMDEVTEEEAATLQASSGESFSSKSSLEPSRLEVAPNPNDGRFRLLFELPEQGTTEVRILDATGTEVYRKVNENFNGLFREELDLSSFAKGIYFLQINQNERTFSRKIITQ